MRQTNRRDRNIYFITSSPLARAQEPPLQTLESSHQFRMSDMMVKSEKRGGAFHEPPAKPDSGWRLNFNHFSLTWFIICCWCTILFGFLAFWFIRRAWRRQRAWKIMSPLGVTIFPPSSGLEFNSSCPICISDFAQDEQVVLLPCGHMYKPTCLRKQLSSGYLQCGVCRANLV